MPYDNTNSGILTANSRQRDGKQDPTHQGSINIDGKEYWLSAWVNTGKEGGKLAGQRYFSIKVRAKDEPQNQGFDMKAAEQRESARLPTAAENRQAALADFDDDIPFAWVLSLPVVGLIAATAMAFQFASVPIA